MKRAGIFLLVICAVLAMVSAGGSLARAASKAGGERFLAPAPADTPTPSFFVYMPLVLRDSGAGVWENVIEEGFETPGSLWDFWGWADPTGHLYYWARSTCQPYSGSYSAWAVGGGADGALLSCGSTYPDNVDSWMAYGPFSLADATAASLSFKLWLNVDAVLNDYLCMYASSDGNLYDGACLTYQPDGWGPVTFRLDDALTSVDMRGQPEVWIAFEFVSNESVHFPEGAYVDDVVVRKCAGGICPTAASAGAELSAARMRRAQTVVAHPDRQLPVRGQ